MKRLALLLALATAGCAQGGREFDNGPPLKPSANPSAVIAAEIAFSQLAQDKGQWTAFRDTAAAGAEMFVPERVAATVWLKGRANPAIPVKWQPHAVWSSCDGSYSVTRGAWERPGSTGSYVTVWQRQKDGKHKWLIDMSLSDEKPSPPPEMVTARVADCAKSPGAAATATQVARAGAVIGLTALGSSDDSTIVWRALAEGGKRSFAVSLWNGSDFETVIDTSAAPGSR